MLVMLSFVCTRPALQVSDFDNIGSILLLFAECAAVEGEAIIQDALSQADNPQHSTITCTAGT